MTIRFRLALMLLVGGVALACLLTVGIILHANARSVARDLSEQVLGKLAIGIEGQTEKLLGDADAHCQLTSDLLNAGQLKIDDFTQLVTYWSAVLRADSDVTSFYLAEEATGEAVGVNRLRDNEKFWVWQTTKDRNHDRFELSEYLAADYPQHAVHVDSSAPDLRQRHWYLSARDHKLGFWTNTYVFLGLKGIPNVLGVSFVLPLRAANGNLSGVMTADFDLSALSRFLANLHVGETGSAFILERNEGQQLYVVAHPQADLLLVDDESNQGKKRLTPVHQFPDSRVRAFAGQLPATLQLEHYPEAGKIEFSADGQRYLGTYRRIIDPHQPSWVICTFLAEDEVMANAHNAFRWSTIVMLAVILLAMVLSFSLSREVALPLERLAKELLSAGRLQLDENPKINSFVHEVNELAAATKEMKTGLRSFQKFVPADLVRTLLDSGEEAQLGGHREEVAVFFSDIAGFTSTSETLEPEILVKHLGEYLGAMSDEILKLGGTVDKFIGDSVMAFWEASKSNGQHAASACAAAIQCQARLRELRQRWLAQGLPPMETRIGIHTGEAILGNIGSHRRMNFTIIGDTVNLGSRLEGLNKTYRSEILISEHTYQRAKEQIVARPLDWVNVKGRTAPVLVYELLGMRSQLPAETSEFVEMYGEALNDYRARRWSDCIEHLEEILRLCDNDWPATVLKGRCYEYLSDPPPADWDGVLHLTEK